MRDWRLIYGKTATGEQEAQKRDRVLLPALRRALILCDGRKTLGELSGLVRAGEIDVLIQFLETAGFIHEVGLAAHLPSHAQSSEYWTLDKRAVPFIVKRLISQLGHRPELINDTTLSALERCATPVEVRERLRLVIEQVRVDFGEDSANLMLIATRYALTPDTNWPPSAQDLPTQ